VTLYNSVNILRPQKSEHCIVWHDYSLSQHSYQGHRTKFNRAIIREAGMLHSEVKHYEYGQGLSYGSDSCVSPQRSVKSLPVMDLCGDQVVLYFF